MDTYAPVVFTDLSSPSRAGRSTPPRQRPSSPRACRPPPASAPAGLSSTATRRRPWPRCVCEELSMSVRLLAELVGLLARSLFLPCLPSHRSLHRRPPPTQQQAGQAVVLVRKETTAEDIHGMKSSVGVLTEQVRLSPRARKDRQTETHATSPPLSPHKEPRSHTIPPSFHHP